MAQQRTFDGHTRPTTDIIQSERYTYACEYDASNNLIYLGHTVPGNQTSDPDWLIRKLTYDASNNLLTIKFANGDAVNYQYVWDNRGGYTYS